jgi:hypothetical protein
LVRTPDGPERSLKGIERARSNVAKNHPERGQRQECHALFDRLRRHCRIAIAIPASMAKKKTLDKMPPRINDRESHHASDIRTGRCLESASPH